MALHVLQHTLYDRKVVGSNRTRVIVCCVASYTLRRCKCRQMLRGNHYLNRLRVPANWLRLDKGEIILLYPSLQRDVGVY